MEEMIYDEHIVEALSENLIQCEKCHHCNNVCPVLKDRLTQGPFGINRSIYYSVKWDMFDEAFRNLVYSCTTCGRCVETCKKVSRALPIVDMVEKARELLLVEKMLGPMPEQNKVLKNMHVRGNPWGNPSHERTQWTRGLDIKRASKDHPVETVLFVGCAASYDPQAQKIARNLSWILQRANVEFGILENEVCSGSEAKRLGETGLFQYLSETNLTLLEEAGAKRIITADPHSLFSFTHEYPKNGLQFIHYTQYLNELTEQGRLDMVKPVDKTVTYHDPCYLGRRCELFDPPRKLIKSIPGATLIEMETIKTDSECCGMGGGRMWMEPPEGLMPSQRITEKRLTQASNTGAQILLTACPFCNIALSDASKSEETKKISVMDITELVAAALE